MLIFVILEELGSYRLVGVDRVKRSASAAGDKRGSSSDCHGLASQKIKIKKTIHKV